MEITNIKTSEYYYIFFFNKLLKSKYYYKVINLQMNIILQFQILIENIYILEINIKF